MEKTLVLKAQIREKTGSKATELVRKAGRIPATVYGHKQDAVSVSLDEHNLVEGIHHGSRVIDLEMDGKTEKVLLKELQYDAFGRNIIHADLMRVNVSEKITVSVPVVLKGTAKGTQEGGILSVQAEALEVECTITSIPESLIVSVKEIGVGEKLSAKDVELPAGVSLVSDPEMVLAACSVLAEAPEEEEAGEEGVAEPEVIGKKKEEETEE